MKKILLTLLLFLAAGCLKTQNIQTYSGTWHSGFEGYFTDVSYTLDYDVKKVSLSKTAENTLKLVDLETGKESQVLFFNNDGAGFASSQDIWENHYKILSNCSDCKIAANILNLNPSNFQSPFSDILTFENPSEYWVIIKTYPGFITMKISKGSQNIQKVLETLTWHYTKTIPA